MWYSRLARNTLETYRSGHNGPDSKSGSPQGLVGSNPTASARKTGLLRQASFLVRMKNETAVSCDQAKEAAL